MSVHPNGRGGPLGKVRYPAATIFFLLVALAAAVYFTIDFPRSWLVWTVPVLQGGGTVVYRKRFRSGANAASERERQFQLRGGFATPLDQARGAGYWALRRRLKVLRPSLAALPWWRRIFIPGSALGHCIGFSTGWLGRRRLYATVEQSTGVFAPAGGGKTGALGSILIDADGAVLATTVKPDLVLDTINMRSTWARPESPLGRYVLQFRLVRWCWSLVRWVLRRPAPEARPRPVWVFNPEGIGDIPSTVRWNPLLGCEDIDAARERAGYMMSGAKGAKGIADASFWEGQGVRILSAYLHLAALGEGLTIMDVNRWVGQARKDEYTQAEVRALVAKSPAAAALGPNLDQWFETNDNTASSTETTISQAVQWLSGQAASAVAAEGEVGFDIDAWLEGRGTLYLLAEDREHSSVAPLFSAFVGWILKEAMARGAKAKGGRLDPHLTLVLDEVCNVAPIPLVKLVTVVRGFNISMHLGLQSPSQLADKYGENGARTITNNLHVKSYTGGFTDDPLLESLSKLCGKVWVRVVNDEAPKVKASNAEWREVPVMRPERIKNLPDKEVLMMVGRLSGVVLAQMRWYWERPDVKLVKAQHDRAEARQKKLALAAAAERKAITDRPAGLVPEPRAAEASVPEATVPLTTEERQTAFDLNAITQSQWHTDQAAPTPTDEQSWSPFVKGGEDETEREADGER
jgi:hypothetical protein